MIKNLLTNENEKLKKEAKELLKNVGEKLDIVVDDIIIKKINGEYEKNIGSLLEEDFENILTELYAHVNYKVTETVIKDLYVEEIGVVTPAGLNAILRGSLSVASEKEYYIDVNEGELIATDGKLTLEIEPILQPLKETKIAEKIINDVMKELNINNRYITERNFINIVKQLYNKGIEEYSVKIDNYDDDCDMDLGIFSDEGILKMIMCIFDFSEVSFWNNKNGTLVVEDNNKSLVITPIIKFYI